MALGPFLIRPPTKEHMEMTMNKMFELTGIPFVAAAIDGTYIKLRNRPSVGPQDYWTRKSMACKYSNEHLKTNLKV